MNKCDEIIEIRKKLKEKEVNIIPYSHPDFAWTHYRQWHEERYILILNEVLDIMKSNPDFTWMTDNENHMLAPFIKNCPQRVHELRQRILEGRLEITNGTIALARSTQIGDETFVRNITYGKRYFEGLVPGIDINVYNNVDVSIGHSQLPQLLKLGGYKYLWAWRPQGVLDYKGIPGQFTWKGLDGTSTICSRGFYGGFCNSGYLDKDFDKNWDDIAIQFYHTDLEGIAARASVPELWVTQGMDDCRPLRDFTDEPHRMPEFITEWNKRENCKMLFSTARRYFEKIATHYLPVVNGTPDVCDVGYNMPTKGEKGLWRMRQELDRLIVKAEILCSFAALAGEKYPQEKFDEIWMMILGISGHAQEGVLDRDFEKLYSMALAAKYSAQKIIDQSKFKMAMNIKGNGKQCVVFNTLNWERDEIVPINISNPTGVKDFELFDADGNTVEYQICSKLRGDVPYKGTKYDEVDILASLKIPAMGYTSISVIEKINNSNQETFGINDEDMDFKITGSSYQIIDTGEISVKFCEGKIAHVSDKNGTIIFSSQDCDCPLNEIKFTTINHHSKVAWLYYSNYRHIDRLQINDWRWEEYGPLRWKYVVEGNIGAHQLKQEIILYKGKSQIDFNVDINCTQSNSGFFSAGFPIERGSKINTDIPFGTEEKDIYNEPYGKLSKTVADNIERTWKGVFVAKSFVNYNYKGNKNSIISENCGRYFLLDDETISIILTRVLDYEKTEDWEKHSHPWVDCIGKHNFKYSLYVQSKPDDLLKTAKIVSETIVKPEVELKKGHSLNEILPIKMSMQEIQSDSAILSAFYKEENKYIMRIYEAKGHISNLKIRSFVKLNTARAVDFLGNPLERNNITVSDDGYVIETELKPWEILNIVIEML